MRLLMHRKQYLGGNRLRNLGPWHQYLTANSDRLSHFGHRMSLFLRTLVLRGIWSGEQEHRLEEFHMKKILTQYGVCALAVALVVPLSQAQPAALQAAFSARNR